MNVVKSAHSISTITHNGVVYDTNAAKAELFVDQFQEISSDNNLTTDFMAHRVAFAAQHRDVIYGAPVPTSEQDDITVDTDDAAADATINQPINNSFEMHELVEPVRLCKNNSSPGADRITNEIIKKIPKRNLSTIRKFYNLIWKKGKLSASWKESIITPSLKPSKSAFDPTSYRSIALTSVLCKIMKRMIAARLRWFMEEQQLFNKFQSGFRKQRSCIGQIMRPADDVHKSVNNNLYTLSVMIESKRAFELVWHDGLLFKMTQLGLDGNIFKWVKDFLTDRTIQVLVGTELFSVRRWKIEHHKEVS